VRFWLLMLLLCSTAEAGTVKLRWTLPATNADTLDCLQPGAPITNLRGTKFWGWRFGDADTLYFGEIAAPQDSADFVIEDGSMGVILSRAVKQNVKESCQYTSYLFAIPAVEYVPPTGGLTGNYYRWKRDANGIRQFDTFLASRVDTTVDFEWGTGVPMSGVPADSFCVRWTGTVNVPTSGNWTLYVSSEDGFRLYVDGALKRDWWQVGFEQEIGTTMLLAAGAHPITLEYFANVGHSACHLRWSGPGVAKQAIPRAALSL